MAAAATLHNPNDDNIFALTYNLCWGCMQNSTKDLTGVNVNVLLKVTMLVLIM